MTDVFISYSRKDSDFMRRLHGALAARKRDIWVDWEDIPLTADWWREISSGIEAADTFLFIISPDSVRSEVCQKEIEHAAAHQKRIIPVLHREVIDDADKARAHPIINSHNWVFFRDADNFEHSFDMLMQALDTDLSYVREHTRLLVRGREWQDKNRDSSLVLRGADLAAAEAWLFGSAGKTPIPTDLHRQYISVSRRAAAARQRTTIGGLVAGIVVALVLAVFAFFQWQAAAANGLIAEQNAATATFALGLAADNAAAAQLSEATAVAAVSTLQAFLPAVEIQGVPNRPDIHEVILRQQPGDQYQTIGIVPVGSTAPLLGRARDVNQAYGPDNQEVWWFLIEIPSGDGGTIRGWVRDSEAGISTQNIEIPVLEPAAYWP